MSSSSSPVTILVLVPLTPDTLLDGWKSSLPSNYTVLYRPSNEDTLPTEEEYASTDAIFMFQFPANLTSVEQVPKLKLIQLASAGSNQLDGKDFTKSLTDSHPLIIASASGIHVAPIAEHVIATTMMLLHQLPRFVVATRTQSKWHNHAELGFVVRELRGLTIGVLGYGHIGREIARMGQAMGMKVLAANRTGKKSPIGGFLIPGTGDHNGDIPSDWYSTDSESSMHDFYSSSDVVVNTLPSSPGTDLFVGEKAFRSMRNDALYVNIGRGSTTDQEPLITALQNGLNPPAGDEQDDDLRIAGASLDVTTPEPLPKESPLYTLENVVLTPHMSGMSRNYFVRAVGDLFSQNLERVLEKGEGALNAVRGKGE